MKLAILKVILWPNDTSLCPRIVPFETGKINVITGESCSGKSTLTWIIDYCLGSEKCSIPVGLIREVTGWFGLHLKLANTEMIVARRNPEDQQETSDLYWNEGVNLDVPPRVQKNARVDDLKSRLNQISYLSSLDFSSDESAGFGGPASFRDMAAFNFQPQHIVANPFTLFYKADTTEHREKLRIVFPLVLGAIDTITLAKQRELKDTMRQHDGLRRELDARRDAARAWEAEVESYYMQARGLGLLPESPKPEAGWTLDKYILELREVPARVKKMDIPDIREGTGEAAVAELTGLLGEEDKLAQDIGSIRRRLGKLDQLATSVGEYGTTLLGQEDRLHGVGWFEEKTGTAFKCPICSAVHPNGNPHLNDLQTLAREWKALTASVQLAPAKLDKELADLRLELRDREGAISKVRQKRRYLEDQSAALAAQRQRVRQIYLFVGRIEQALESLSASSDVGELRDRVAALEQRISDLRKELDPGAQAARVKAAADRVSTKIADYARLLQLEHAAENVRLNTKELTLQFGRLSGRSDYLWEVGSGQNWVGYHIAGLLALHEHFASLRESPVPRFLVIDQPSQVYFPDAWPSIDQTADGRKAQRSSSDIEGVHRIFVALSQFLKAVDGQFQVIVTEHAGRITWDGVPNIHLVGNWREGHDEFLIPNAWSGKE